MSDSHDLEMQAWAKTAQDENDRAQELEVRLEAAEKRLSEAERVVTEALAELKHGQNDHDPNWWKFGSRARAILAAYDAAVPARGDRRAPEGGSTPPAAIETRQAWKNDGHAWDCRYNPFSEQPCTCDRPGLKAIGKDWPTDLNSEGQPGGE